MDIADSLASSLQQPFSPVLDIPISLILSALCVDRSDIAVILCKIKFSMILQEEGGPSRGARLLHYVKTFFRNEGSTPEENMLVEGLECAFDQGAVDLFRELVRCFVRPGRLPPDHSVPEQMRLFAKYHPKQDHRIMVVLYEFILRKTPSGRGRNDRLPFLLLIIQVEIFLLPLVVLVWFFMPTRSEHKFSPSFTLLIACGSIFTFISMVARPKGEIPFPEPVRGTYNLIRFFVELLIYSPRVYKAG